MNNFGNYLRSVRLGNMTQRQLAKRVGVSYPYISKLENNIEPPPRENLLVKLSESLEVDPDEMFIHANKIPKDIIQLLLTHPKLIKVLREAKGNNLSKFLLENFKELMEEKEKMFYYFFYENSKAMLLIDPNTSEIVNANPKAEGFYNYSLRKLKNMNITEINTLSREEVFEEMTKAKLELRRYFNFKHKINHEKIVDVEVQSIPIILEGRVFLNSTIQEAIKR